jgi:Uma2 family endonuclease
MTVEHYEALVDSGAFTAKDRFHLINGYLVAKMTQNPLHVVAVELCGSQLLPILPHGWHLRQGKPVRLPRRDSEPEPDCCVVRGTIRDYEGRHPGPSDVAIVVEIADSSLSQDREMAAVVYGPSGIPVCWIVNLINRQVELYADPGRDGYGSRQDFREGKAIPVTIDGRQIGQVVVDDILPSRAARQ